MGGSVIVYAMFAACAAPVPLEPAHLAPAPRLVKPDISLIVSDLVPSEDGFFRARVLKVGFHNGKALPAEVVWEGDERGIVLLAGVEIRANRYLVSARGAVLDLREKKLINAERDGEVVRADDTRVTYWVAGANREQGLFAFEYATGTLTRLEKLKQPRIPFRAPRSPDGTKAINWVDGELFLHRDGQKPKSLGTGFKTDRQPGVLVGSGFSTFPVLWIDNDRFLTQRGTGKLVTVDLDGKVADVIAIKDFPKAGSIGLIRDHAGSIIYYVGEKNFKIDLANKTTTPTDWGGLGHGFEISWEPDTDDQYKFRHKGKDIGRCDCWPYEGVSAPGYVATPTKNRTMIAVCCAATGEWTTLAFTRHPSIVGWIK